MKSFVLCRVPRAGLGNQLLTWAKAATYAKFHNLEFVHYGWSMPGLTRIRRILKGNETWLSLMRGAPLAQIASIKMNLYKCQLLNEPRQEVKPNPRGMACIFRQVPPWQDYFQDIRDKRDFVLSEIRQTLRERVWDTVQALEPALVIANVRMDDFKTSQTSTDFATKGGMRTPFEYFESTIQGIRKYAGWEVPIHVVSDGAKRELVPLLNKVSNLVLVPQRPAIINLLWMSKARAIIASSGSTFSFWAGFLGEAAILHHPAHAPKPLRTVEISSKYYDGPVEDNWRAWPELLKKNLFEINNEKHT